MDHDLHREDLLVLRPLLAHGPVLGRALPARLGKLLQPGLGVDWRGTAAKVAELIRHRSEDELAGRCEAAVEGDGADDSLVDRGKVRRARAAAGALLAPAEQQAVAQTHPLRQLRQAVAPDQVAAPLREVALGAVGTVPVKPLGDDVAQHGVAQELETLIRFEAWFHRLVEGRGVHEGLTEKGGPTKTKTHACLCLALERHC